MIPRNGPELLNSLLTDSHLSGMLFKKISTWSREIVDNNNIKPFTDCLLCVGHIMLSAHHTFYINSHDSPREVIITPILEMGMQRLRGNTHQVREQVD